MYADATPPFIWFTSYARTADSYASVEQASRHGVDELWGVLYAAEAMSYAEEHWGEVLVRDSWDSVVQHYIMDPTQLSPTNRPAISTSLYVALNKSMHTIEQDYSEPRSSLIGNATVEMGIGHILGNELLGKRRPSVRFNCGYCGHGFGLKECKCCGHTFDNKTAYGWTTPLPKAASDFLVAQGFSFSMDPEIARKCERDAFNAELDEFIREKLKEKGLQWPSLVSLTEFVSAEFLEALHNNQDYGLVHEGRVWQTFPARTLMTRVIELDPGLQDLVQMLGRANRTPKEG